MSFFDKLAGTRAGNPGVVPVPEEELRAALLALGGDDWSVGDGADDHCDLLAAWGISRSAPRPALGHLKSSFKVKMKFHGAEHEVHYSETSSSSRVGTSPNYSFKSSDVTNPLRDTVTSLGWTWKFSLFKL